MKRLPRPPRSRTLLLFGLLLVGGAVINVAVAWGFAVWAPQNVAFRPTPIECPDSWPAYLDGIWPPPTSAQEDVDLRPSLGSIGVSRFEIRGEADPKRPDGNRITSVCLEINRFGVPARSLQWEQSGLNAGSRSVELLIAIADSAGWRKGIRIPDRRLQPFDQRVLPFTPVWPGFAINTIFYAGVCWLLVAVPFAVRRRRRIKRGLCPACAYPVGTNTVCTECGIALKGAARAA